MVRRIVSDLLTVYLVIVFARVMLSWFPLNAGSPIVPVARVLHALTEPVLAPIRRVLPQARAGAMAVDFSPIVVFIVILILQRLVAG